MIYYTRTLKTGEKYTTAYKDLSTAKRIATQESTSVNKSLWDGELYYNLETGEFGEKASGVGLVSHIKSTGNASEGGRYAVLSLLEGKPNDLGLRFDTYGNANKFIRAIVGSYTELFVVEMEKTGTGSSKVNIDDESISVNEAAPF